MAIGINSDDTDMYGSPDGWSSSTSKAHDTTVLLKECLYAFNALPNRKYDGSKDTYSLASKIGKFLKENE